MAEAPFDVATWARNAPLSTAQEWDFTTSANPIAPDGTTDFCLQTV
jgi:hypothetical protein